MKKSTHPLLQLLVMLAMSLGMLFIASTPEVLLAVMGVDIMSRTAIIWSESITQILAFLVPVVLMTTIYYRGQQREFFRLDFSGQKWYYAAAGVAIMLLFIPLNDWLTVWNDSWDLGRVGELMRSLQDKTEGIMAAMFGTSTVGGLISNLVVVALIPAVCEEVFFRAGIQNLLQRWLKNPHAAIWITAVVFSLGHGEVFAFMPRMVIGAVLGYLYIYGGSLLPNMIAHFVNNAIIVVLYWLVSRGVIDIDPEAPLALGGIVITICSLAAITLFYAVFVMGKKERE